MSKQTAKWLRQVAEEIRKESHAGWGNTCEMAAGEVDAMQARIDALEKAARDLLNAETDRWAAQTDHAVFAANAVVVAAHDSLAALLEEPTK